MFSQENEYNCDFIEYTFENNSIYTSKAIYTNKSITVTKILRI